MKPAALLLLRRLARPLGRVLAAWLLAVSLLPLAMASATAARGPQGAGVEHEFCVAGFEAGLVATGLPGAGPTALDHASGTSLTAPTSASPAGAANAHDLAGCLLCPQCVAGLAALPTPDLLPTLRAPTGTARVLPAAVPAVGSAQRGHAQPRAPPAA